MLRSSVLLLVLAVSTASPAGLATHIGPQCPLQPIHMYHAAAFSYEGRFVLVPAPVPVSASDTNPGDCNGGIFHAYDGDLDVGGLGGAFGYGPFAKPCLHHRHGGNYLVSDNLGVPVQFWIGADDQAGPFGPGCLTDGIINPSDPNDCLHGPYVTSGPASPCTGGGDGLIWILLVPPAFGGTIAAY